MSIVLPLLAVLGAVALFALFVVVELQPVCRGYRSSDRPVTQLPRVRPGPGPGAGTGSGCPTQRT